MLTTTVAMLVTISGPLQGTPALADSGPVLLAADDAHTLFTPNASDPGRAGQVVQLPGGGAGVTSGGTSHYQTYSTPGGGAGVAVPNGSNSESFVGSGARSGTAKAPN